MATTELQNAIVRISMLAGGGEPNIDRAYRALLAVDTFARSGGPADPAEPLEDILSDMIADMAHLARALGIDLADVARRGIGHATAEING